MSRSNGYAGLFWHRVVLREFPGKRMCALDNTLILMVSYPKTSSFVTPTMQALAMITYGRNE